MGRSSARWYEEYQMRHERLFAKTNIATVTKYTNTCMFWRNRYLIDSADLLLAAYDEQPGGTVNTADEDG